MNVLDKDGNLTGFGRELADAVIKEVGGGIEHIHSSQWTEVLHWLETGKADFIQDTGYTQERDQFLDYSDPIIEMPEVIFVRPDEYSIQSLDSLKGRTVACVNKHITHLYLKEIPGISLFVVKTPVEGIFELISGKVDAFVYPKQIALYLVQDLRLKDKIKITGPPLRTLSWSMVVKQGNEELVQRLNEGIAKVRKSGQYDSIYNKWWGEKILSGYTKEQLYIFIIITIASCLAAILSIIFFLFSRRLKQRVKEKTFSLSQEIEGRKTIEDTLEKEKEFINAVLENISDGIVACDKEGILTLFNRATKEFHCLPEKPIPAKEWAQYYDLFLADGMTPMKKENVPLFCALQGAYVKDIEMVIAPKQGKKRIVQASGQPLHDERGNLLGAVATMHDISDRKYAEVELQKANALLDTKVQERTHELLQLSEKLSREIEERKKSEENLALSKIEHEEAQQIAKIGHWALDLSTDKLTWSDEVFRIFNLENGSIEPTYEYFLSVIHPDDKDDVNTAFNDSITNKTEYDITHRLLFNDGSTKYIHEQGKTFYDQSGTPYRSIGTVQDISLQKTIEHEKEQLMQKLQQSQKMESIGTLAGGIAHDFNNILMAVMGYTELAMIDIDNPANLQKDLDEVLNGAKRARDLVQQILTFSRKADKDLQPLRIQSIVKEAIKLLRSTIPTTIEIKQDINSGCEPVLSDPVEIHQVIMNLCTNAYHSMRETGGILEVSLHHVELTKKDIGDFIDLSPGSYLKLEVNDTGVGMKKDVQDRIFDPYYTTKSKGDGTGLGLAVVHGIITSLKGDIKVYSEPGRGTTFEIYLPTVAAASTRATQVEDVIHVPEGNERILLVDDDASIVQLNCKVLLGLGYKITAFTSSIEAFQEFQKNAGNFDLVITDMTMPGMTGAELAEKIFTIQPDFPIILCSGFSDLVNEEKARTLGIRAFVSKPVTRKDLAETIRKVLDGPIS